MSEYKLTDGSKINLVVKREASSTAQPPAGSTKQQTPPKVEDEPQVLVEEELFKVLRKHFKSDNDTKKVVTTFKQVRYTLLRLLLVQSLISRFLKGLFVVQLHESM